MSSRTWTWITSLAAVAWLGGAALAAAVWLGGAAQAAPPERMGPPPHGRMAPHLAEALGLSDEQQAAVEALQREQMESLRPVMEQQRQLHEAFQAALEAPGPDPAEVGRKALAMHAGMKKMKAAHDAFRERLAGLLDASQKEKLKVLEESGLLPGPGRHPFGTGGPMGLMRHPQPPPDAPRE